MRPALIFLQMFSLLAGHASEQGRYEVHSFSVDKSPVIDGKLDDRCWTDGGLCDRFVNRETGAAAAQPTEVRVIHDSNTVYFGLRCMDPQAGTLVGQQNRYDGQMMQEDHIEIDIDTFNDKRTCYCFRVNVLGTRFDGRSTGFFPDPSWDGDWQAAVGKEDGAWIAEIAIPLKMLKFPAKENQEWGVNFLRYRRSDDEKSSWAPVGTTTWDPSKFGALSGIRLKTRSFLRTKYSGYTSFNDNLSSGGLGFSARQGFDVNHPLTSNFSAYITLRPDFSQVESELIGITLSDVEVRTAEKRPFFQEGSELFRGGGFPLFFSKRLGEMDFGARLYGTLGRNQLYFLDAQTAQPAQANHQVLRVIRQLGEKGSSLGFSYVGKEAGVKGFSRSWGGDLAIVLSRQWRLSASFATSRNFKLSRATDAYSVDLFGNQFPWTFFVSWEEADPNLRTSAEDGFIFLDDTRGPFGFFRYEWRNPFRILKRAAVDGFANRSVDHLGQLSRDGQTFTARGDFTNKLSAVLVSDRLRSSFGGGGLVTFRNLKGAVIAYNVLQAGGGGFGSWQLPTGAEYPAFVFGALTGETEEDHGVFYVGAGAVKLANNIRFGLQGERSPKRVNGEHQFSVRSSLDFDLSSSAALVLAYRQENGNATNAYMRLRWNMSPGRTLYVVYGEQETFDLLTSRFVQTTRTKNRLFMKIAFEF